MGVAVTGKGVKKWELYEKRDWLSGKVKSSPSRTYGLTWRRLYFLFLLVLFLFILLVLILLLAHHLIGFRL